MENQPESFRAVCQKTQQEGAALREAEKTALHVAAGTSRPILAKEDVAATINLELESPTPGPHNSQRNNSRTWIRAWIRVAPSKGLL